MIKIKIALVIMAWLALGLIGAAAQWADIQREFASLYTPYFDKGHRVKNDVRVTCRRDWPFVIVMTTFGPLNLPGALISTGGFSSGLTLTCPDPRLVDESKEDE